MLECVYRGRGRNTGKREDFYREYKLNDGRDLISLLQHLNATV